MTVGQTLTVTLPWDPSTGYRWQPIAQPDARMLIILDSGFERPPATAQARLQNSSDRALPNEGRAWWKLRATGEGSTSFGVQYVRPWEPDAGSRQFSITVDVKPAGKPKQ